MVDGRSHAEGQLLVQFEDLEVVEDHRLAQPALKRHQGTPEQQHGVPAEVGADTG
jgi:hypothetical protein